MHNFSGLKIIALTVVMGSSLFAGKCEADIGQNISSKPVIQIDAGDVRGEAADAAMQKLAAALRQHPQARLFRVNWTLTIGGWGSIATALYDRRKHTIKFYCSGGEQFGDALYEHCLYLGVTDAILSHVAEKFANSGGSSDGHFDSLPDFGCRLRPYKDNKGIIHIKYKQPD